MNTLARTYASQRFAPPTPAARPSNRFKNLIVGGWPGVGAKESRTWPGGGEAWTSRLPAGRAIGRIKGACSTFSVVNWLLMTRIQFKFLRIDGLFVLLDRLKSY